MNNEQMRTLNTTDGWEEIVNGNYLQKSFAREQVAAKKRERKIKKLWLTTCGLATLSLTFVILGAVGAVAGWLTTVISVGSLVGSSILFGRYVEVKRG